MEKINWKEQIYNIYRWELLERNSKSEKGVVKVPKSKKKPSLVHNKLERWDLYFS